MRRLLLILRTWLAVGDGSSVFSYVMNEHFAFAHILAGVGLLCIFGFYLLMRNSPIMSWIVPFEKGKQVVSWGQGQELTKDLMIYR